jgi:hypothetical protein
MVVGEDGKTLAETEIEVSPSAPGPLLFHAVIVARPHRICPRVKKVLRG